MKVLNSNRQGRYATTQTGGETVRAYIPPPLPPDPPIAIAGMALRLSAADRALGRLDGGVALLPDMGLFLYMYVRKEAVLSSQIEGAQSTLSDLLRFETDAENGEPVDDIREVSNYVDAMRYGIERLPDFPLSLRLIRELHQRLLRSGRGMNKNPGEFRNSQNWIGGTRPGNALYVPPPVAEMQACLHDMEAFIHATQDDLPPLIKAALLHHQFETIHPFLDGNGRVGRLLITLYLCSAGVLQHPLLYLSLYFKTHRQDYYRLLQEVRENGNWEAWIEFFLDGVTETANQAFDEAMAIVNLFKQDRDRIPKNGANSGSVLRLHGALQAHPYITARHAAAQTGLSMPTVNTALDTLQSLGIVHEVTGKKRGRVFCYTAYMAILGAATQQPAG